MNNHNRVLRRTRFVEGKLSVIAKKKKLYEVEIGFNNLSKEYILESSSKQNVKFWQQLNSPVPDG